MTMTAISSTRVIAIAIGIALGFSVQSLTVWQHNYFSYLSATRSTTTPMTLNTGDSHAESVARDASVAGDVGDVALAVTDKAASSSFFSVEMLDSNSNSNSNPSFDVQGQSNHALHMLDCDKHNSTCRSFYPVDFFEHPLAPGYSVRHVARRELYDASPHIPFLPINFIRFWHKGKIDNVTQGLPYQPIYPPPDFTYIHSRKAGGITMKFLGWRFMDARNISAGYRLKKQMTAETGLLLERWGHEYFAEQIRDMANKTQYFTLVRNPVSRFLSAMGQFVALRHEQSAALNCTADMGNIPAAKAPPAVMIRCVLQALRQGNPVDEHFGLATYEMYQATGGLNVSVSVLPLSVFGDFMQSLGVKPFRMNKAKGVKRKYANVQLLQPDMIADLCHVYAPDVHMLRAIGQDVPECDAHVPVWGKFIA